MNLTNIIPSLEQLPMAIALVGPELMLQWSNCYLREHFPYLDIPDLLPTLLVGQDMEEIRHCLETVNQPVSYSSAAPLVSSTLTLSPLYNGVASAQNFQGAVVHLALMNHSTSPLSPQQAERALHEFNSSLRNPLSSMFASLSSMALQMEIEEIYSCQSHLSSLTQNCYKLLRSCTSITEYSRYCNGLAVLNKRVVDIVEFTKNLLDSAALLTKGIGASISYTLPQTEQFLSCDPEKLAVALLCILSNCCTYFEEQTTIHTFLEVKSNALQFRITDTGFGIAEDVMPHIFEPYYSHGKDEFALPSLGLGLPLAKMIISHHKGTMAVHSQPDNGTTVAFTLPLTEDELDTQSLPLSTTPSSYITDRFSSLYVFLSNVINPPKA